jgi:hypothetical protein
LRLALVAQIQCLFIGTVLAVANTAGSAMSLKRLYHSVSSAQAALYTAFGSPGLGITWAVMSFLGALLVLIYDQHNRHPDQSHKEPL